MASFPVRSPQTRETCGECRQDDEAQIRICGVVVSMVRRNNLNVPAEFSAYIPRAEIRRRFQNGRLSEEEIILSSITLVHSPRHRPGGEIVPAPPVTEPHRCSGPGPHWDDNGTWSGPKVAAAAKGIPRIVVGGRKRG